MTTEERLDNDVKKQYVCAICIRKYSSRCALNRHLKVHENKTFKCSNCTKTFQTKANLTRHNKSVHTGSVKQHLCSYCGEWYRSRGSLIRHVKFIHKNHGKVCSICSKMCRDNAMLQRHLKSHFNDLEQCKGCHGHFKDLRAHKMSCPVTDRNPIFCEFCGKQFLAKRYLADHIKYKHIQSDKYLCHCGKIYPYRFSFKRHQLQCVKKEDV